MKKTLTEQYRLIKEDKGHKGVFLKEAKKQFPNLIRQGATYNEASKILKQRNIISENFVGIPMVGNPLERKKEGYENAFENFIAEAEVKAEEKKVSKEVEEDQANGYDTLDKKDPNNMIFGQIQMGYYCEYKDPKNEGKTDQELLEIVYKNLAKDPIFYTKNGQFGEKDLGYTDEAPSLGEPVEPKGEYKSSGYGKLKEHKLRRRKKLLKEEVSQFLIDSFIEGVKDAFGEESNLYATKGDEYEKLKTAAEVVISSTDSGDTTVEELIYTSQLYALGLSENTSLNEHSISMAGGIVSGTGFSHKNYMDYFNLNEAEGDGDDAAKVADETERALAASEKIADLELFQEDMPSEAPEHMEAVADAVEMAYEAGMSIEEITEFVEQHLGLKMGDY